VAGRDYVANPADLGRGTLVDLFFEAVDRFGTSAALRYREASGWRDISYQEVERRVAAVAAGFGALGLARGDRAAILSSNRPEWALSDYGCLCAGVVAVPIYPTLTAPQVRYVLTNSGARLVFVSDRGQLDKVLEIRGECPALEWIVVFDAEENLQSGVLRFADLLGRGETAASTTRAAFRDEAWRAGPDDLATIIYTSGTTGDPKGVMLTHNNLYTNVRACSQVLPIDQRDSSLSFLPLSHVFQRMVDYLFFNLGCSIAYARSIQLVTEDLKEVRPTFACSVPRLYEKIYATVTDARGLKGAIVHWAMAVGAKWAEATLAGRRPGALTRAKYALADRLVFRKLREAVGGRLRHFVSGGGPLSPEINRFFFSAGIVILEGYGLTETSPVTNVNGPRDFPANYRIGTVGKPVPGTEVRIAEDGEIVVRGPQVMKGYYNLPDQTAEALTPDGWFLTGDIGEIDSEGFLRITDRKKDIIVTAGGKKVAPQTIENLLKRTRYVDQPVLIGDRRKFVSLLLVPNFDAVAGWARAQGLTTGDRRTLLSDPRVQELLNKEIFSALQHLSSFEMPKKILLLDKGFTVDDGSLTPSLKVKRRVVEDRYRTAIDALYEEASEATTVFVA
jgi:long-chain acyl-CoA synthetase